MSELQLAEIKAHLIVEHDGDDALIQSYIDRAESHVAKHLRRDMAVDFPDGWPADIKQAVCLIVASFYANREQGGESGSSGIPFGARDLLSYYRNFA